jgi:hypothetical protein
VEKQRGGSRCGQGRSRALDAEWRGVRRNGAGVVAVWPVPTAHPNLQEEGAGAGLRARARVLDHGEEVASGHELERERNHVRRRHHLQQLHHGRVAWERQQHSDLLADHHCRLVLLSHILHPEELERAASPCGFAPHRALVGALVYHGRASLTQLLPYGIHVLDRWRHQASPDVVQVERGEHMALRALAPPRGIRPDEPAKPPATRPRRIRHELARRASRQPPSNRTGLIPAPE